MARQNVPFRTPTGRLVQGDVYILNDKDQQGRPRFDQSGKPKVQLFFALAVPKTQADYAPINHNGRQFPGWMGTDWGRVIAGEGFSGSPSAGQVGNFSWKVTDGDSTEFNQGTPPRRWCDIEGFKGCWVIKFSGQFVPRCYNNDGSSPMVSINGQMVNANDVTMDNKGQVTGGVIKTGWWVQVAGNVVHNENPQKPGVYINPSMVSLQGFAEEITSGPNPLAVGFGQGPAPAGMMASAPMGAGFGAPGAVQGGVPQQQAFQQPGGFPGAQVPQSTMVAGAPVAANGPSGWAPAPNAMQGPPGNAAPVGVQPHAGFMQPGGAPAQAAPGGFPGAFPGAAPGGFPAGAASAAPGQTAFPGAFPGASPTAGAPGAYPAAMGGAVAPAGFAGNPGFPGAANGPGHSVLSPPPQAAQQPQRQLTAKAGGHSYQQLLQAGWTDATLLQHGYMV